MNTRKLQLGDRNLVGARVTQARHERKMKQLELLALADIFAVSADWLLGRG